MRGIFMKKKNKRSITKRKKEFRFHDTEELSKHGKAYYKAHPAYVFLEKGNKYVYVTITHSSKVNEKVVIKLRQNPNPNDSRDSYRVVEILEDTKKRFGRNQKSWKMDSQDDFDIRAEYEKSKKK